MIQMRCPKFFIVPATLVASTLFCLHVTTAHAIDSCKIRVDKRTGVILVDATNVVGTLQWGSSAGQENGAIFNAGTCVAGGKAKKCQIGDPMTLTAKTAPTGCTLYLDDGTMPCSAWIPGCSPGQRQSAGALVKDSAGATIGYSLSGGGVVRQEGSNLVNLVVNVDGSGFNAAGSLVFLTNNCSGTTLMAPDTSMIKFVTIVSDSIGYYGPTSGTLQNILSVLYPIQGVSDQPGCDGYFGPGTTFLAPHGCCLPIVSSGNVGAAISVNLGGFVPPFSVELP